MKAEKLNLVIENGCHHFYTESGERIWHVANTQIRQDEPEEWGNKKASFLAKIHVNFHAYEDRKPCTFNELEKTLHTPSGKIIDAKVTFIDRFEGVAETVTIIGICNLPFDTNHK